MNIISTGCKFAKQAYNNHNKKYRVSKQIGISYYAISNPFFAYKWFHLLLTSKEYERIFSLRPRLYIKPFHPYLCKSWGKERKLKIIVETYEFLKKISDSFYENIVKPNEESSVITPLIFNNEKFGSLKIGYSEKQKKEGELRIFVEDNFGSPVIVVTFSIEKNDNNQWECFIGCVQGNNKDSFRTFQKLIHGMRPNNFIVFCLQEWCKNLGCDKVYGIRSKVKVNQKNSLRRSLLKMRIVCSIIFKYDDFWISLGAKETNKDWFELQSTATTYKDLSSIKSNKRSMYKKRYDFLEAISLEISKNIEPFKSS